MTKLSKEEIHGQRYIDYLTSEDILNYINSLNVLYDLRWLLKKHGDN